MKLQLYGWPKWDMSGAATTQEEMDFAMRQMRDTLLSECDWTQLPDCQLSADVIDQWKLWRQYMRDLPTLVDRPLSNVIQFNDPPEVGRPWSWDNWDIERGAQPYGTGPVQS